MQAKRPSKTLCLSAALAVTLSTGLFGGARLAAQSSSVYQSGAFELGDGVDPVVPGIADIAGSGQPGPDWANLFGVNRSWKDVHGESGSPGPNGVPDFLDSYGPLRLRSDAVFLSDTVSAGTGTDPSTLIGAGQVGPGVVDPGYDLGNAYAYSVFSPGRDLIVYLALERLANADGKIRFEVNRGLFLINGGQIAGSRAVGDLRVDAQFSAGILSSVTIRSWEGGWALIDTLPISPSQPSEQCNAGETLCAVCNGSGINGGGWQSYDAEGNPTTTLVSYTFVEIGVNVSALLGLHTWQNFYSTRYTSLQISTYDGAQAPQDYGLGHFTRARRLTQ